MKSRILYIIFVASIVGCKNDGKTSSGIEYDAKSDTIPVVYFD